MEQSHAEVDRSQWPLFVQEVRCEIQLCVKLQNFVF